MVRIVLILVVMFSWDVRADFLGFKTGDSDEGKIPKLVEKLKKLEMVSSPTYEESFNQLVKTIETTMEEEKLFCSGETADSNGKVIEKGQKQLCFRELKGSYLEALDAIFELKIKYLGLIHSRQVQRLTEIQKKLKSDIDKSF